MSLQKYTKEWLEELCQDSSSLAEVLRKAGRKPGGGSQATLKQKIQEFSIDISHFSGQGWSKGKTAAEDSRIQSKEKYSLEEILIEDSPVTQKILRGYIERHNVIPYKCAICGCTGEWQNGQIALELDHINGINTDNRVENLRFLCPNCHALTETYRGRNKTLTDVNPVSDEDFVAALRKYPNIHQALMSLELSPAGGNYSRAQRLIKEYNIQK